MVNTIFLDRLILMATTASIVSDVWEGNKVEISITSTLCILW